MLPALRAPPQAGDTKTAVTVAKPAVFFPDAWGRLRVLTRCIPQRSLQRVYEQSETMERRRARASQGAGWQERLSSCDGVEAGQICRSHRGKSGSTGYRAGAQQEGLSG